MSKSALNELCVRNRWSPPVYSTTKDGPPHAPTFYATVTVNGAVYASSAAAKSSKDAQNDAARVACLHLPTSSPPAHFPTVSQHMCKAKLKIYAEKKNLPLPVYSHQREGPPHLSRFKCGVTIHGKTYESEEFFPTLKEAENSAAKVALAELQPEGSGECFQGGSYKNMLQEIFQKRGGLLPVYETTKFGVVHTPSFISKVEVEGQVFAGLEEKTKKLAETSAAKVAYLHFVKGNSSESPILSVPASQEQERRFPSPKVDQVFLAHLNQHVQPKLSVPSEKVEPIGNSRYNPFQPFAASQEQEPRLPAPRVDSVVLTHLSQHIQPKLFVSCEKVESIGNSRYNSFQPFAASQEQEPRLPSPRVDSVALTHLNQHIQPTLPLQCRNVESIGAEPSTGNTGSFSNMATEELPISPPAVASSYLKEMMAEKPPNTEIAMAGSTEPTVTPSSAKIDSVAVKHPTSLAVGPTSSLLCVPSDSALPSDASFQCQNGGGTAELHPSMPSALPPFEGLSSRVHQLIRSSVGQPNRIVVHPRNVVLTYPSGSTVLPMSDDSWVAVRSPPQATM